MITVDGIQYRNLEEQVKKNQDDIKFILEEEGVLNQFGIKVVAQVSDTSALPDPSTYGGEYGDAYAVGTASPYTFYIFTRANGGVGNDYWFNVGVFPAPGPAGPQGPKGDKGERGFRGSIWTTGNGEPSGNGSLLDQHLNTSNGNVYTYVGGRWQLAGNIRGPQGATGPQGAVGPHGPQGDTGPVGPKGDPGPAFVIEGVVADVSLLPDPATVPDNVAYLVGTEAIGYDLYVQLQGGDQWFNVGSIEMVSGPKGDTGPAGPQGPQGPVGSDGHSVYTSTDSYAAAVGEHGAIWQSSTDAKGVGDVVITTNGKVGTIVGEDMIDGRATWYILNAADIKGPKGDSVQPKIYTHTVNCSGDNNVPYCVLSFINSSEASIVADGKITNTAGFVNGVYSSDGQAFRICTTVSTAAFTQVQYVNGDGTHATATVTAVNDVITQL